MTMRRGSRRSSRRSSRPRERTGWTNSTLFQSTVADGATAVVDILGSFTVAEKFRIGTIKRILWSVNVRSSSAGALVAGRFGIIRVTDDAMSVPTIPSPIGDPESSWMLNNDWQQQDAANVPVYLKGDLRSQRRLLGDGQTLAFAFSSDGAASAASALFGFALRILYTIK